MDEDAMLWSNSAFAPARSLILALKDNRFTWKASFERCRIGPFCTSNNPAITRPTKQEDTVFHACPTIPFTSSVLPHSRASLDTVHTPLKHRRKPPRCLLGTMKIVHPPNSSTTASPPWAWGIRLQTFSTPHAYLTCSTSWSHWSLLASMQQKMC